MSHSTRANTALRLMREHQIALVPSGPDEWAAWYPAYKRSARYHDRDPLEAVRQAVVGGPE